MDGFETDDWLGDYEAYLAGLGAQSSSLRADAYDPDDYSHYDDDDEATTTATALPTTPTRPTTTQPPNPEVVKHWRIWQEQFNQRRPFLHRLHPFLKAAATKHHRSALLLSPDGYNIRRFRFKAHFIIHSWSDRVEVARFLSRLCQAFPDIDASLSSEVDSFIDQAALLPLTWTSLPALLPITHALGQMIASRSPSSAFLRLSVSLFASFASLVFVAAANARMDPLGAAPFLAGLAHATLQTSGIRQYWRALAPSLALLLLCLVIPGLHSFNVFASSLFFATIAFQTSHGLYRRATRIFERRWPSLRLLSTCSSASSYSLPSPSNFPASSSATSSATSSTLILPATKPLCHPQLS